MDQHLEHDHNDDGVDRRGFLTCMAWAGTGMLWAVNGGVLSSVSLGAVRRFGLPDRLKGGLFFAQISDSHIGFSKEANHDVTATLLEAVGRVNALPHRPAFVLHTGDISQLSKPSEFDTADQVIRGIRTERVFYVPGEHDVLTDDGRQYLDRYGKGTKGSGWYSFDHTGVHFIGLVNVVNLKAGGLGALGPEQLAWLAKDVRGLSSSTPIVVFAHIPLWSVYPDWGWGTDDSEQALALLRRFGSVTVLNGHIHQVLQKVEGSIRFHTAQSTAFPQPAPGTAPSPGPLTVEPGRLRSLLGIASAEFVRGHEGLAVIDSPLAPSSGGAAPAARAAASDTGARGGMLRGTTAPGGIGIDNFSFTPAALTAAPGAPVSWTNHDDVPHKIVSADKRFDPSPVLDTGDQYTTAFKAPGRYEYFCALHPRMTGTIVVG
ncbi:MAG TPA: metallophosphoesterase [Gemmatimonadales bacterium]|nr:metallophosphoesterase [Gemmatimonadales bacterium]